MIQFTKTKKFHYILLNKKHKQPTDGIIVPIHRSSPSGYVGGSPLGNPFLLKDPNNDIDRNKVCDEYEQWILDKIKNNDVKVTNELQRIRELHEIHNKVYLQCFCTPKRCHGETIIKILRGDL